MSGPPVDLSPEVKQELKQRYEQLHLFPPSVMEQMTRRREDQLELDLAERGTYYSVEPLR